MQDKFAVDEWTGRRCFMADGPSARFNISRTDQELTPTESAIISNETKWNGYWKEEHRLQNQVAYLLSKGCKLRMTESLEEFVMRCAEILITNPDVV
jgi:hypothetical protein